MRVLVHLRWAGALVACALAASPVVAQGSYSPYDETPTTALARYIRDLASNPHDFASLIGAGKAALEIGDTQAAAGFFARADDVNPRSPLPQAGMGAVSVANGDARAAIPYFKRAQQLGASTESFACDRGLAYDMMGQQALAQADYRLALSGRDGDEARRRLALSLAISGDRSGALQMLAPLAAKGDAGVARVRAFVLALTGDSNAAMMAINAAMPGSSGRVAPFLQRLPRLSAAQKAAAVNFGIFPDSGDVAYAAAAPMSAISTAAAAISVGSDRLAGIDSFLQPGPMRGASPSVPAPQPGWQQPRAMQVAYAIPPAPSVVQRTGAAFEPGIWLQLASGSDIDALAEQYRHLKARNPDIFDGIKPFIARSSDGARLVIGPFRGNSDAEILSEDLQSVGVSPLKWTNSQSDRIAPLPAG